jgi:hypothetical protein
MTRVLVFALLGAGMLSASAARARVDVAPAPREIRPDGTRDPAPQPDAAKRENPLDVVARIIKNSNAVGDKLAMTDTGAETLGKQGTILKDIESLIDRQENPPPPKPDQNQDKNDKKPDDMNKKGDMGDKNDMPPKKKDMGDMGMEPMGGDEQPQGRRPRQQEGNDSKQKDGQSKDPSGMKQQAQPMNSAPPKEPKNTGGKLPDPKPGDPQDPGRPLLPFEDEIVKDVWGHLPDRLRQQATQYYQQDFMPRYTELLKLYYSSLAEKGGKK